MVDPREQPSIPVHHAHLPDHVQLDHHLQRHQSRVAQISYMIGAALCLDAATRDWVVQGARLHDAGKRAVPTAILNKSGPLTSEEWSALRRHPQDGVRLLAREGVSRAALSVVLFHHERWDGQGYPYGLRGAEIPLGARIVAIADTFDAITNPRAYRAARSAACAAKIIEQERARQFDPSIADAFLFVVLPQLGPYTR